VSTPTFKGEPTVVPMSGNAFQVWSGYQLSVPILFYNRDLTNNIYLSYQPTVYQNAPNAVILNPQSSVTMDGSRTIYAIGPNNAGPLQIIPGGTNYQTSNPPVSLLATLGNVTAVSSGNPVALMSMVPILEYASYDINIYAYQGNAGAANAPLGYEVQIQWFDDTVSGIPIFEEDWWLWAGRAIIANTNTMGGCGPMHGLYMSVNVAIPNAATSALIIQSANIFGSQRSIPYSDWRQNAIATNPESNGLQLLAGVNGAAFDNVLASCDSTVLSTNPSFLPLGLYAGPVFLRYDGAATPAHAPVLATIDGLVGGQLVEGTGCPGILWVIAGTTGTEFEATIILPRAPCALMLQATGSATSFSFKAIAQQAA
jgi:hypothetical protein